ncbi:thiamine diphosphokinase [Epibacterium ulvae]|uniref:Thiamine diphosphokinase n=1 Tax=Epibacterium ulvae TaxID=1156985 RepID=A0A1G5PW74_9RHOB|nr:thiamine diphosphokinase [Epibacterium ulvae]SCZ53476.1 thiamine diphosphokinase [Epibacterium ulvae]
MTQLIVEQAGPVTLVGGGALQAEDLRVAQTLAPYVVAADSGADQALAQGVRPDLTIGDLDSISAEARVRLGAAGLCHIGEQDSTDFDKALRAISAPVVLAVGFLGARLDHQLAVLHSLVQPGRSPCILIGAHEIVFHLTHRLEVSCAPEEPVSLFSLTGVQGRSTGLRWPIDGLTFHPMQQIGTSNKAQGPITLEADGPGMLVMLQKSHLKTVMAQV